MDVKDYYGILQIEPSAGLLEIKQAYRKLAKQLHPDKKPGDKYAAAQFAAIKEAYEVLTDPSKKEYYLQQRWYNQSIGKKKKQEIITPVAVLQQVLELDKYVATLDVFRMDKPGLQGYLLNLVTDDTIEKLKAFNEPAIYRQIIITALRAAKPLPYNFLPELMQQLQKLAGNDISIMELINHFKAAETRKNKKEKFSLLLIIILTIIICAIIWLAGR